MDWVWIVNLDQNPLLNHDNRKEGLIRLSIPTRLYQKNFFCNRSPQPFQIDFMIKRQMKSKKFMKNKSYVCTLVSQIEVCSE